MSISENREQQRDGYAHARCSCESGGGGSYAAPPQKSGALLSSYIVSTVMVCPAAAAAAVQIIQSAVGGTGSGRKPRNRIHTLCGPWKRNVEGKQQGGKHFGVRMNDEVQG